MRFLEQLCAKQTWAPLTRLTVFAMLFGWANVLHQLSYPEWIRGFHVIGWLLFISSVALSARPTSMVLFIATLTLRIIYTIHWTPMIRGHLFLEGLFTVGILLALTVALFQRKKTSGFDSAEQEQLFESFAPFLRLTSLVVYAAVTISKLNIDFIDHQKSAAVQLLFWTAEKYPWVPNGSWVQQISIWGTLVFEASIPILICFRRTRWLGVVIGLFFHTLLAFLPLRISSFTLTMCLLLYVWLPANSAATMERAFRRISAKAGLAPGMFIVLLAAAAGTTGMLFAARRGFNLDMRSLDLGMGIWWWQTVIMFAALWSVRHLPMEKIGAQIRMNSWLLRLQFLFIVFNCLCPYIGLKTRSSLTMHCNLRTEAGYWNHLFLPEKMRVFTYQDQLIEIVESDLPDFDHLREHSMALPYFEFGRWCRLANQDFRVVYQRWDGSVHEFEKQQGKGSDAAINTARPMLEKFLCFNPVGASHDYIPGLINRTGPPRNVVPRYVIP
jgi:hypothetical protein